MIFYVVRKCAAVCFGIGIASSCSSAMTSFILTNSSSTCSFNFLKMSSSFLTVWKLRKFAFTIFFYKNSVKSTCLVLSYTINWFHEFFAIESKILYFLHWATFTDSSYLISSSYWMTDRPLLLS